jgi:hypothetical protein
VIRGAERGKHSKANFATQTKAPRTLSSHGTPLRSISPPPKAAHNHSTMRPSPGECPDGLLLTVRRMVPLGGLVWSNLQSQPATFELGLNIQGKVMAYENAVLSLNPDGRTLLSQESTLRENGFEVISVSTPLQARFEIEMGRCGVFLTSHITPLPICRDLISLFRVSCPDGTVVFLTSPSFQQALEADIVFSAQDDPQSIVKRLCSYQEQKAS